MNHRRPNPDELTPDDLFRPESEASAHYAETQTVAHAAAPQQAMAQQAMAPQSPAEPQAAATQFLPPIPAAPAPQPGFAAPYQAAPAPGAYQPQQQHQAEYGQPQQHQDYQQGGYQGQYAGYEEEPPRGGPSMRTIAIGVVAACAVVGIGMGAMLSGGDSSASASPQASGSAVAAAASGGKGGGAAKPNQAQAQALSALLQNAANNRSAVIGAVSDIQGCQAVPQAQQTLSNAAQARANLVNQLNGLKVDQLPRGAALVSALTRGWQASQQADSHYAAWAAASINPCQKKHHPAKGGEKSAGDTQSGIASRAKSDASSLWNPIATADGLPTRSTSQL